MPRARDIERRRRSTVFIAEDGDATFNGRDFDHYLTGRFSGFLDSGGSRITQEFEDLSLDDALAWARERADRIVVRSGPDAPYVIGAPGGEGRVAWPEDGIPPPTRRRFPGEEWKDRTDADPDARWVVTVALGPPLAEGSDRRAAWDAVAEEVAGRLGARASADELDGYLADAARAMRRAKGTEAGWATSHMPVYTVPLAVEAPTAARAEAEARAQLPAVSKGWNVEVSAAFVGG